MCEETEKAGEASGCVRVEATVRPGMEEDIKRRKCWWVHDQDDSKWDTECGNAQCFIEGGPKENEYRFCPYCGKPLLFEGW